MGASVCQESPVKSLQWELQKQRESQQKRRSPWRPYGDILVGLPGCAALCEHKGSRFLRVGGTWRRGCSSCFTGTAWKDKPALCSIATDWWPHIWLHSSRLSSSEWGRCPWPHLLSDQGCCSHCPKSEVRVKCHLGSINSSFLCPLSLGLDK